jgi:hypothetical protein
MDIQTIAEILALSNPSKLSQSLGISTTVLTVFIWKRVRLRHYTLWCCILSLGAIFDLISGSR